MTNFYNKLKEHTEEAMRKQAKKDGMVYIKGIGMEGGYVMSKAEAAAKKKATPKATTTKDNNNKCSACGEYGHKRRTNKKCKYYVDKSDQNTKTTERDAEQLDAMNRLSFDNVVDTDEMFDCLLIDLVKDGEESSSTV